MARQHLAASAVQKVRSFYGICKEGSPYTSEQLAHREYHWGQDLTALLEGLDSQSLPALHLGVSVRSFRAEKLSEFVGAVVAGEAKEARALYQAIRATYPIILTRELGQARDGCATEREGRSGSDWSR